MVFSVKSNNFVFLPFHFYSPSVTDGHPRRNNSRQIIKVMSTMWYFVILIACISCALTYLRHWSQYLQKTSFHKCQPPHNISTSKMLSHVPEKKWVLPYSTERAKETLDVHNCSVTQNKTTLSHVFFVCLVNTIQAATRRNQKMYQRR